MFLLKILLILSSRIISKSKVYIQIFSMMKLLFGKLITKSFFKKYYFTSKQIVFIPKDFSRETDKKSN